MARKWGPVGPGFNGPSGGKDDIPTGLVVQIVLTQYVDDFNTLFRQPEGLFEVLRLDKWTSPCVSEWSDNSNA